MRADKRRWDINLENLDVLILCGGMGRRLKSVVSDRPKPMAEIDGRPFLDIIIDYAAGFGFKRFILCAGHMGDIIKEHYEKRKRPSAEFIISQEKEPLGTGGALRNAQNMIKSSPFLVMNGDSFCRADLTEFIRFHEEKNASFSVVLARSGEGDDCGNVGIDASGAVVSFEEKTGARKGGLVNAGIYLLDAGIFSFIPRRKTSSLEKDIFPVVTGKRFYGYVTEEELIDIGTPERYRASRGKLQRPIS